MITNTYYLQMYLKLIISKQIFTDFYVTLDSDILFTKKFNLNNFYNDNKAFIKIKHVADVWTKRVNSCLQIDNNIRSNQTPFVFKTRLVVNMLDKLNVYDLIMNQLCSEYTLFIGYLIKNNLLDKNYQDNELYSHMGLFSKKQLKINQTVI